MRKGIAILLTLALGVGVAGMAACTPSNNAASAGSDAGSTSQKSNEPVRIGTMPTEDILPAWVAEKEGFFEEVGVDATIVSFDSAQTLSAAIAAGEVDMAMVDVMRAVKLCESGTPVVMEWITLGAEASQGAFGVMAAADAPYANLQELAAYAAENAEALAGAGVGVAANTVPQYVYEKLCAEAGVDAATIPTEEVASLPERYSLMAAGKLAAAALPASMLEMGKANGLKLLADDTTGDNLSQSVMVARASFADTEEGAEAVTKVAEAWNQAVDAIAADPAAYRVLLAEKANLNGSIAETYPVSDYPYAMVDGVMAYPPAALVEPQIVWMSEKGYSTKGATYDEETGVVTVA